VTTFAQVPPWDETCVTGKYPPTDPSLFVPTYVVNLDLPAEQRWVDISKKYSQQISNMVTYIKKFVLEFSPQLQKLIDIVDNDLGQFANTLPNGYGDEIKGIANATNIQLGELMLYNMFYEIFTLCTSIVGQDQNGKMYHARNLDFGLFLGWDLTNDTWIISELLRPLIINVNYTRNNELLYKSVTFVGYVGLITAVKPGEFSYSMNERYGIDGGYIGLFEWILNINRDQAFATLLARDIIERDNVDFYEVSALFAKTPLLAPCYYIIAGPNPNEGAVITRDREGDRDIWQLGTNNTWFLVQTNYDHWKAPLFIDDRVTPANTCMQKSGQEGLSFEGLFNVLSSKPVLNKLTVYSALMEVETGRLETYIQYCPTPCQPF